MQSFTMTFTATDAERAAAAAASLKERAVQQALTVEAVVFADPPEVDRAGMPQVELERLPGETEVEFSLRAAQVQQDRLEAQKIVSDRENEDTPIQKFNRLWPDA